MDENNVLFDSGDMTPEDIEAFNEQQDLIEDIGDIMSDDDIGTD